MARLNSSYAMKGWSIVVALVLLGASPMAHGAHALPVLAKATAAADACKVAWPAEKLQTITVEGSKFVTLLAEFARPSKSLLCMRGSFWRDTPHKIHEIANPASIKTLVVSSDGGWTEPAIELAKLAERYGWLIVLKDVCLSSCANYVFLSRARKVVLPKSVVGWHGTPPDPSEVDKLKASFPSGPEWEGIDWKAGAANSKRFLAERKIPPELCRSRPQAGHSKEYVVQQQALADSGAKPFWSYGKKALEKKFNVRGILSMWEPQTPEEGTEFASKQRNTNIFFFDLSSR